MLTVDEATRTELEAAAFRRLVAHLRERTDVQNIDLMNLAGFCRNCLSNWIEDAARERHLPVTKSDAREHVYGMPAEEWKRLHQRKSTPEQARAFRDTHTHSHAAGEGAEPASRSDTARA
jgi:hypothetical protein